MIHTSLQISTLRSIFLIFEKWKEIQTIKWNMLAAALNLAFFFFYFQKPQEKLSTGQHKVEITYTLLMFLIL